MAGDECKAERTAIAPISKHELAFVVGAPRVIGGHRLRQRRTLRFVPRLARVLDQAMAIARRVDGTDGGCAHIAMPSLRVIEIPDRSRSTPTGVRSVRRPAPSFRAAIGFMINCQFAAMKRRQECRKEARAAQTVRTPALDSAPVSKNPKEIR
jgi:hypothetical protein